MDDWDSEVTTSPGERKILRLWGGIFRFLVIAAIGIGAYIYLDPPSIMDRPLASLTLRDIAKNVTAAFIAVGCISWFFSFPSDGEGISLEDWGKLGAWVAGGAILLVLIILNN
jgi:hypothetical protein